MNDTVLRQRDCFPTYFACNINDQEAFKSVIKGQTDGFFRQMLANGTGLEIRKTGSSLRY
jgi:hypothetical protein